MADCIFCDIVAGRAPASVVFEAPSVLAFLDTAPMNPGHVLVIPKAHLSHLADLDTQLGAVLFQAALLLSQAVRRAGVRCEGVNLYLADGVAAWQHVLHVHLHLIPRFTGDNLQLPLPPDWFTSRQVERARLDTVAAHIRAALRDVQTTR